ncbi:MAG: Dabb family protein [Imperialibacter sp.]|uniref:Dabb family protein n=1 Tax=Imperialibacter sp. TaxID=2038411 RepID=UPI003A855AAC
MKDSSVNFYHVVYFWLNDPSEANKKTFLSHVKEYTGSIDVIKERFIGTPADTNRPVIDNTYTFNIILAFDSKKDQDAYQEHPVHLAFVEKAQHMWSKVQVYDSVKV